ncbi:MAG: hypothetical protein HY692_06875, partial [Cyanobacteria bacterium NC_groundwater_1444_Ag_S-0.65um_54_12]|nr:hypothetical protein [Cyanobacteria bacterium NC_groundwater_1444_Ag_S-0.65um_54_12]
KHNPALDTELGATMAWDGWSNVKTETRKRSICVDFRFVSYNEFSQRQKQKRQPDHLTACPQLDGKGCCEEEFVTWIFRDKPFYEEALISVIGNKEYSKTSQLALDHTFDNLVGNWHPFAKGLVTKEDSVSSGAKKSETVKWLSETEFLPGGVSSLIEAGRLARIYRLLEHGARIPATMQRLSGNYHAANTEHPYTMAFTKEAVRQKLDEVFAASLKALRQESR